HLRNYAWLSQRREIWDYITNATGSRIDSGEHSRGAGPKNHGRVSAVAWHCARLSGGTGSLSEFVRKAGLSRQPEFREFIEDLLRDQQNAQRPDEVTGHSPLTTVHYTQVRVHGVDVFKPQTGEVISDDADGIACWFIDTDYNEESFFVRHAYF